jgi:cytochrome P450
VQDVADLDLPALAYDDPALAGPGFHEVMRELRERTWLARAEPVGWFVLDREAATFFLRTPKAKFPGRLMLEVQGVDSGSLYERLKNNLLDLDGDHHRRLRRMVQPSFTPPAADAHRPAMRAELDGLWEALGGARSCEAVEALAAPYPARMIARVMGAPVDDAPRLHTWANLIQGQFDPIKVATILPELERAAVEFQEYAAALVAQRRGDPGDDLISVLIAAEEEGDRLSEAEVIDLVSAVLVGGVDTTQSQLAHGLRLFAQHPDQWAALARDPALVPAAVEELLRFEPITPFTARITREDVEFRDVRFPAGTFLFAAAITANHDPAVYEAAERFDVCAPRGREKPLTFGAGPHFCPGASLARAELEEALAFLAPRMPGLALDGEPVHDTPLGIHGLLSLPIRWD